MGPDPGDPLLSVRHLTTTFDVPGGQIQAVDDISFDLRRGETLGLVGESGSGKSVTALSMLRLVQPPGRITAGSILFNGRDLLTLTERHMRRIRGADIALIFQEPMTALDPVFPVGDQIAESLTVHGRASRSEARARAIELLRAVQIAEPERRSRLSAPTRAECGSGVASALACQPSLLIADEPTTALDVTIQADILHSVDRDETRFDLALLLITHDPGRAGTADRVAVICRPHRRARPRMGNFPPPGIRTCGLLASIPGGAHGQRLHAIEGTVPIWRACPRLPVPSTVPRPVRRLRAIRASRLRRRAHHTARCLLHRPGPSWMALVEVRHLAEGFWRRAADCFCTPAGVRAVSDVSLIEEGETFGPSANRAVENTTGRCILRLIEPTSGEVMFRDRTCWRSRTRYGGARDMQIVFQDPFSSLNPRMRASEIVAEPLF